MDKISIEELNLVVEGCYSYLKTGNNALLVPIQDLIKKVKAIDESIKTYKEYEQNKFLPETHNLARMAVMLLNSFGELCLDGGLLTIYEDDKHIKGTTHTNTYELVLKDYDTHFNIYSNNPTWADKPYDFNTKFKAQTTIYANENMSNTTKTAWDSFANKYQPPSRTLDFKSALWKSNHEHFVDYIIQLQSPMQLVVFRPGASDAPKHIDFVFNEEAYEQKLELFSKYFLLLRQIKRYPSQDYNLSWDAFIL